MKYYVPVSTPCQTILTQPWSNTGRRSGTLIFVGVFFAIFADTGFSQKAGVGSASGRVIDHISGEPLLGVTIIHRPSKKYVITGVDGKFSIQGLPAGKQTIEFQLVNYRGQSVPVTIRPGQTTKLSISLKPPTLKEVIIKGRAIKNTAASLLKNRQKSAAAQDTISSEQISKSPDNNAADAVKRVTGISIVDGRYVYVRGLSERYSLVLINRSVIPSPNPSRRIVPLDILPVALLDNMIITKSYLGDLPGAFGAGLIQLNTKDYPEEEDLRVTLGIGYNSQTTFLPFYSYTGGNGDFFGFDDGTRALPDQVRNNPNRKLFVGQNSFTRQQLQELSKSFSSTWTPNNNSLGALPGNLQLSYGNQFEFENGHKLGIISAFIFRESSQNVNGFFKRLDPNQGTLPQDYTYVESAYNTRMTAQFFSTYGYSSTDLVKLNAFYIHGSSDRSRINSGRYTTSQVGKREIIYFDENNLLFNQLLSENYFSVLGGIKLNGNFSFSWANRSLPSTRSTNYINDSLDSSDPFLINSNEHNEFVYNVLPEAEFYFQQWDDREAKLKVGGGFVYQTRTTENRRFQFDWVGLNGARPSTQDLQNLSPNDNIDKYGIQVTEITGDSPGSGFDAYHGLLSIGSVFSTLELPLFLELKFVAGVRIEFWNQTTTAFNQFNPNQTNVANIGDTDFFPHAGLIYNPTKLLFIRLSFSQTINRPDFIEASNFKYFDDIETGTLILGNPDLKEAILRSYDLRFEWFPTSGEVVAVTGFAKTIDNPIEAIINTVTDDLRYSFANQENALLVGVEFEIRKDFGFIYEPLKIFSIITNFTYVYSQITLARNAQAAATNSERALQGLSPFLVNAGLLFNKKNWGTSASILYNHFADRIVNIGVNGLQDIYEVGRGRLDVTLTQNFLTYWRVKLTVANVLNPLIQKRQSDTIVEQFRRGINVAFRIGYQL